MNENHAARRFRPPSGAPLLLGLLVALGAGCKFQTPNLRLPRRSSSPPPPTAAARRDGRPLPQPDDALTRFFAHARSGNFDAAYRSTTPELRQTTSPHQLASFLQSRNLLEVEKSAWVVRSREGSQVRVDGAAITRSGEAVPLAAVLTWAGEDWQIGYLALNHPERLPDPLGLPPLPRQAQWVTETLRAVARALNTGDYSALHRQLALSAQATSSPAQLAQRFARFRERRLDITPAVENLPVILTASNVWDGDRIEVTGYYDSRPLQLRFQIAFEEEGGGWRPATIRLDATRPPEG